jgi:DNA-binding winged helix-turn-helix (wHTH) protein
MRNGVAKVTSDSRKNAEISPKPAVYRVAGLEVDSVRATVRRNGAEIPMRPKTYQVLLFMLERHDRLIGKEELLSGVWGGQAVSDDVLVQSISELRKAFGDDPKEPRIFKTHPRLGYTIVSEVANGLVAAPPATHRRTWWIAAPAIAFVLVAVSLAVWWRTTIPRALPWFEVAWWKLDESQGTAVSDASGHGHSGLVSGRAQWAADKIRGGLQFDGEPAAVSGKSRASLPSGDAPRTFSAWVKVASAHLEWMAIFDYGSWTERTPGDRFSIFLHPDGRIGINGNGGPIDAIGTQSVADDTWHMVTASYDGSASRLARIFVDGQPDVSWNMAAPFTTDGHSGWKIGQFVTGAGAFRGRIDDVRMYGRALNESQVTALYRCSAGLNDLAGYYFIPIFSPTVSIGGGPHDGSSTPFRNTGRDFTGIQLAKSDGVCGLGYLEGADVGQDLRISVDLRLPTGETGRITDGGPYFRSRRAAPGDGLIGGVSAGYWVQLVSTGMVRVVRLNPYGGVNSSPPIDHFDSANAHNLVIEARGSTLQVWLDRRPVFFDEAGKPETSLSIPPIWDGPPRAGHNEGAAGVAFGSEDNRGLIGGQSAANLQITRIP